MVLIPNEFTCFTCKETFDIVPDEINMEIFAGMTQADVTSMFEGKNKNATLLCDACLESFDRLVDTQPLTGSAH